MILRKSLTLLWFLLSGWIAVSYADTPLGQTLQINTRFKSIIGKPIWTLVVRDVDTGVVIPYMFEIKNNQNFWVAFTFGHNYRVTSSQLKFGPFAIISNFCQLENGILSGKSMILTLSGDLTPSPKSSKCHVLKYNDNAFPIATSP